MKKSHSKKKTLSKKVYSHIKHRLFSGVIIIIPLVITYLVIKFLFNTVDNLFASPINAIVQNYSPDFKTIPGLGIMLSILVIYIMGMLGSSVIIRKLISVGEKMLHKIPLVKMIYPSVKQLVDAFSMTTESAFRQAVYVEYPNENVYVLGFLTNEFTDKSNPHKRICAVFVPTTPNPTSGFLLFYPKEDVIPADMSIDEAVKTIMSGGIVFCGTFSTAKDK